MKVQHQDLLRRPWAYFRNTHLQGPKWLFTAVIKERDYDAVLGSPGTAPVSVPRAHVDRALRRFIWFWPRVTGAERWAQSTSDFGWNPQQYLHTEPTRLLNSIITRVPKSATVLDLGCNSGSDVHLLAQAGYTNLAAVDAGAAALDLFQEEYPATFAEVRVERDLFQRFLLHSRDNRFDAIYSNGATIELLHPSFPVVRELCRVAKHWVLLDLNERQGFPRDYVGQFARQGFRLEYLERDPRVSEDSAVMVFVDAGT